MRIGNDLVDLTMREAAGKARDERFVRRVFTSAEAELIGASEAADRMLWLLWSGKEAAFKVVRKLHPLVPFAHRAFEVAPGEVQPRLGKGEAGARLEGVARVSGLAGGDLELSLPVSWEWTEERIHCLATEVHLDDPGRLWVAVDAVAPERESGSLRLTERESATAIRTESRQVRRLAKQLAREAGLGDVEIVRTPTPSRGPGPPRLYAAGEERPLPGWDLSLSHDGGFVAAALLGPLLGTSRAAF